MLPPALVLAYNSRPPSFLRSGSPALVVFRPARQTRRTVATRCFNMEVAMMYRWRKNARLAALVGLVVLSGGRPGAQGEGQGPNSQPNPYTAIEQYFKLPEGRKWGSTTAVEIDPDGT